MPGGNPIYYVEDLLGTSRVVTNAAGIILDDSDFYPFGGERPILSSSGNHFKFTGKEHDFESGLENFGARHDSSALGRFMSPDPKPITKKFLVNPQDLNLYSYVVNNPLANVDPDGKDWQQALSTLWHGLHVSFSVGFGYASKEQAFGTGKKVSAQVKTTLDVNVDKGVKVSTSAEVGASAKALGAEAGPQISKPLTSMTMDPQGHVTTKVLGAAEGSLVKLPTGTSSSTNGKDSQLTVAGFEQNVVVPVPTPIGPIPVPTPVTVGTSVSVESDSLWKAIVELFLPQTPPPDPSTLPGPCTMGDPEGHCGAKVTVGSNNPH